MTPFRFLTLGVGDAHSARWYSSSLALECGGVNLLIDCPHPIRKILAEASRAAGQGPDVGDFAGVLLTHLHADHASGIEGFAFYCRFALSRTVRLLAHPAVYKNLWEGHLRDSMGRLLPTPGGSPVALACADYFEWTPLDETRAIAFGPFQIECRPTIHHIPTYALRITAGGRTLGLSADTAFDPGLIDWLAEADLVVHETNVGIHTPYATLAALPTPLRARIRLIHYPDTFDAAASVIEPLQQGCRYVV